MSEIDYSPRQEETEIPKKVKAFKTAKGSVYTYDENGMTTRFKTVTGEQHDKQDLTVFAQLTPEQEQGILRAYRYPSESDKGKKVYVVERQENDSAKIIRQLTDIEKRDKLYLAIYKDGGMKFGVPATLTPTPGFNVFDTRHYEKDGQGYTERHLGNKVTEVEFED